MGVSAMLNSNTCTMSRASVYLCGFVCNWSVWYGKQTNEHMNEHVNEWWLKFVYRNFRTLEIFFFLFSIYFWRTNICLFIHSLFFLTSILSNSDYIVCHQTALHFMTLLLLFDIYFLLSLPLQNDFELFVCIKSSTCTHILFPNLCE